MRKLIMMLTAAVVFGATLTGFGETVTNVRGMQRENSNLVDIYYDLEVSEGGSYKVEVQIEGRTNEVNAATFTGDVGNGIAPGRNHHILWDAGADWPGKKGDVNADGGLSAQDASLILQKVAGKISDEDWEK